MKKIPVLFVAAIMMFAAFVEARAQKCVVEPAVYSGSETWFINNEPLTLKQKKYVKYGLPRVLYTGDVVKIGMYKTVAVFAEPSAAKTPEVIYLPVREGCEFQPYQIDATQTPAPVKKKVRKVRTRKSK